AAFERLTQDRDVADDNHLNIVAPFVHAEMLQPNRRGLPYPAAQTLDAEPLSTQILGAGDARPRAKIQIFTNAQAGDVFHVATADSGSHCGRRATVGDLGVARHQSSDLRWIAADPDSLGFNTVLGKKILPRGDPERNGGCAHARVGDNHLAWS